MNRTMQSHHRLAGTGRSANTGGPSKLAGYERFLIRMQEQSPLIPRVFQRQFQLLQFLH